MTIGIQADLDGCEGKLGGHCLVRQLTWVPDMPKFGAPPLTHPPSLTHADTYTSTSESSRKGKPSSEKRPKPLKEIWSLSPAVKGCEFLGGYVLPVELDLFILL